MLVIKRKMNTIKQLGKRDNAHQMPSNITKLSKNNNLKILLKVFSTSTCKMAQSRCRLKRV
jgi:hypothetical protein